MGRDLNSGNCVHHQSSKPNSTLKFSLDRHKLCQVQFSLQALSSTPKFRLDLHRHCQAPYNLLMKSRRCCCCSHQGVQTLPSPIQFADTKQPYVPGGDKTPYLHPSSFNPQIQAGVAQTLPSGIQFAGDARPYISGSDKGPYLRPNQQPKVIVVPGKSEPIEGFEGKSSLAAVED